MSDPRCLSSHISIGSKRFLQFLSCLFIVLFMISCKRSEVFQLAGTVERRTLELSAPISEVITQIPVKEGLRVEAEQIVVQLDTEVVAAELLAQESALAAAEALYAEAQGEFQRQNNLRQARIASIQALDTARRKRDEALALVNEKKARVLQAQRRLADLTITARNSGVVDQLPFEIGERVPVGGVVAVIISDKDPWVRIWLPARAVAQISPQAEVEVRVEGFKASFKGLVEYVSREPEFTPHYALTEKESAHLVYESRIIIQDAPEDLRPGLPAQVFLRMTTK